MANTVHRTPMMDLLVQVTTSNKICPGDHIINVISKDEHNINYKPNTPIGSLDANTVYIIPKSTLELPVKRMPKLANQPFEQQTFRLQVNLPHNQRMVLRVSPRITLAELKSQICSEKELDHSNHHLVHPAQPDTILDLNATLEVYGCAEISLMSNSGLRDSIRNTSTNIFPVPKIEEERKKRSILRLFSRKKKDFPVETTNGIHTSRSDTTLNRNSYQPKQSIKRKPAPAPPPTGKSSPPLITQSSTSLNSRPESEISIKTTDEIESSISHSRHSSDSSGYHEPSVFSDCSENKSPEASIVHGDSDATRQNSPLCKDYPDSSVLLKRASMTSAKDSNLKNVPSCSNVSISSASRKRKAPQPPISTLPAIESPSSPDSPLAVVETNANQNSSDDSILKTNALPNMIPSEDSVLQESEAIQFLEDVLQESENCVGNFTHERILDDSDTDSLREEREVIFQAEVHANDQDSSDSVVEPLTVVIPDPAMPKPRLDSPPAPDSQPDGCEVIDTSADDSGISHSLTSDADSSVPSLNSDFKTMSDSSCQEEIYCNISGSLDTNLVPSNDEFSVQENTAKMDVVETENGVDTHSSASSTIGQSTISTLDVESSVSEVLNLIKDLPQNKISVHENKTSSSYNLFSNEGLPSAPSACHPIENQEQKCDSYKGSICSSISSDSAHGSASHSPQAPKKLDNFALGCYQKEENIDIYSLPSPDHKLLSTNNFQSPKKEPEVTLKRNRVQPDVKIVSLKDQNQTEISLSSNTSGGNVLEKCAQLSHMTTLPLTGRSTSLFNLTPQKKLQRTVTEMEDSEEVPNGMKRTHSDQNVAKDLEPVEVPQTLLQEQRRLQEEYRHLQEQFISWQKQLMCNQRLLQSENIVPCVPFPSLEGLVSLDSSSINENPVTQSDTSANSIDLRTRSLPRPKTKPLSLKETGRPPTPPLAQPPTETAVIDIDIGTQEPLKRPDSLNACSVDTQVDLAEDKVTQIPSPQDKNTQVPSPQEKITSGTQAPSPENVLNKDTSVQTSDNIQVSSTDVSSNSPSPDSDGSKSQTLPRPRPKPDSALQPSRTMTLNRNTRPKSQVVSVTIGSWQQRQMPIAETEPSSKVASTRSKFLSLENIPQTVSKPVLTTMEKRKLPPVPIEPEVQSVNETLPKTVPKSVEARISLNTIPKAEITNTKPKSFSTEIKSEQVEHKSAKPPSATYSKVSKTVPKQIEETIVKERADNKVAARETTATFKMAKPFVKLSSMKDEPPHSIVGLRKWPLSEPDSKQLLLDDSKNPSGCVQEKIRRAEVDLRKPKSSKTESSFVAPKPTSAEGSKQHSIKVNINNQRVDTTVPIEKKTASSKNTNTIPKSQSLNTELMSVFSKRMSKDYEKPVPVKAVESKLTVTVNGSSQVIAPPPPPPPPPPAPMPSSTKMPTIPPAEQIPTSSRLVMAGGTNTLPVKRKESKKSPTKFSRTTDPREELMLEIRGFGGKQALKKIPTAKTGWHLKVYGTTSTANT